MNFELNRSIEILERTPSVMEKLLHGLSKDWVMTNEGPETWSPFDIIGHLVHGEKADWKNRMQKILDKDKDPHFDVFDRFAQFHESKGKSMEDLLSEFKDLRNSNILLVRSYNISEQLLLETGIHPSFGTVNLRQLLATWVAHDLGHIGQIVRVMARQYKEEVGPWKEYLPILTR